jgi:hypothetical protein
MNLEIEFESMQLVQVTKDSVHSQHSATRFSLIKYA